MNSPEEEWWQVRAGEYVLGTLDAKGRELFLRILRHDMDLQRSVRAWQARLAPLDDTAPEREPPGRVWTTIEDGIRAERDSGGRPAAAAIAQDDGLARVEPAAERVARAAAAVSDDDTQAAGASVATPSRPWRGLIVPFVAALATAASLILGVLLQQQRARMDALEGSILQADGISVILGEDGAPLWLVQADFEGERVRVTALAPPPAGGGGDYQLWQVLPDGGGVAPVALLPQDDGESRETPVPGLARTFDAFAVSLEPDGGSPEPAPTGAVLYQGGVIYSDEEPGS